MIKKVDGVATGMCVLSSLSLCSVLSSASTHGPRGEGEKKSEYACTHTETRVLSGRKQRKLTTETLDLRKAAGKKLNWDQVYPQLLYQEPTGVFRLGF